MKPPNILDEHSKKERNLKNSHKKAKYVAIDRYAQIIVAIRSIIFSKKLPPMPL
jgi:hypothetical protein